jgi:ribosomal-protein-alanine N-acetyltransferase
MTNDDLDRVTEMENAIFPNPWRRSFFRADLGRQQGICIVAEESGCVQGYAVAWGTDEVHLANLAVAAECRRRGVAKELMAEVLRFARGVGAGSVYLEVRMSNSAARAFYAGLGFVPTFTREGYYENGEDALIMELELDPAQQ